MTEQRAVLGANLGYQRPAKKNHAPAITALSVIGAALTVWSAVRLWRMDPEDLRYRKATLPGGGTTGGVKRLMFDQGKAAALAVAGGTLQLLALILTYATAHG